MSTLRRIRIPACRSNRASEGLEADQRRQASYIRAEERECFEIGECRDAVQIRTNGVGTPSGPPINEPSASSIQCPRLSRRKCPSKTNSAGNSVSPSRPKSRNPVRRSASSAMRSRAMRSASNGFDIALTMAHTVAACHHLRPTLIPLLHAHSSSHNGNRAGER